MTPCMIFDGKKDEKGYGVVWIGKRAVFAHRFSYCVANGVHLEEIEGLVIRHACDNPSCIKPSHLCAGSHKDNMDDMVKRRRQALGDKNGMAKLTESEVREILKIYIRRHPVFGARPLSKRFNVSESQIAKIGRGAKWAHLQK